MSSTTVTPHPKPAVFAAVTGATALFAVGILTGTTAQLGLNDWMTFALILALGLVLCSLGKLGEGARYGWTHPLHLAGYGLGVLALIGSVWALTTGDVDPRLATGLLSTILVVKLALGRLYPR